jgi:ParB family transcriptional regulator, chromosome partitioning protein
MTTSRGLGRGLGSLIPTAPPAPPPQRRALDDANEPSSEAERAGHSDEPFSQPFDVAATEPSDDPTIGLPDGTSLVELPVTAVSPNPRQPRAVFDEEALDELARSVALVGLLQPVVVRPAGDGRYELVMGERRWRAAQRAGLETIPALVRETSDTSMLRNALLENLNREDLNALEEAAAYQQLLEDFGVSQEELANRVGRSRPHISNTLRLLRLSPAVQRKVAAGVLTAGHARALLGVDDPAAQDRLATQVIAQGIPVRALEELIATGRYLGGEGLRRLPPNAKPRLPEFEEIASRLGERFETRCSVEMGRRRGKIVIEFASLEDLHRIADLLKDDSAA